MNEAFKHSLQARALVEGFSKIGICRPDAVPGTAARLRAWLEAGRHGQMGWMAEREGWRGNAAALWPEARSVVMLAEAYTPEGDPMAGLAARDRGVVSVYAQGKDYHDLVKRRLKRLGRWLLDQAGGEIKVFVDTAPVMEKPLAQAAGLGWQGKHTNLLARDLGNWVFLGAIFTTLDLEPDAAEIAVRRMRNDLNSPTLLLSAALVLVNDVVQTWRPAFVHPGSYFICANDCHNAIYATRAAYDRSGPYDTSFKIAADFKWIMTCMDAGAAFVYTQEPTVNYSLGGTSSDLLQHSLECMRIVSLRFPFLTSTEVRGLYHCFFVLGGPLAKQQADHPSSLTAFVREVFARHVSQQDFSSALSWALMVTMQHPADAGVLGRRFGLADRLPGLAIRVLRRHPKLYGLARSGYRWLRG